MSKKQLFCQQVEECKRGTVDENTLIRIQTTKTIYNALDPDDKTSVRASSGSGFLVEEYSTREIKGVSSKNRPLIFTAYHVVSHTDQIKISLPVNDDVSSHTWNAEVVYAIPELDFACIRPTTDFEFEYSTLKAGNTNNLIAGSTLFVSGYSDQSTQPVTVAGIFSKRTFFNDLFEMTSPGPRIVFDASASGGHSGGPVVNL